MHDGIGKKCGLKKIFLLILICSWEFLWIGGRFEKNNSIHWTNKYGIWSELHRITTSDILSGELPSRISDIFNESLWLLNMFRIRKMK
jgi:hypothetical protein